jgi:hypothetical protein
MKLREHGREFWSSYLRLGKGQKIFFGLFLIGCGSLGLYVDSLVAPAADTNHQRTGQPTRYIMVAATLVRVSQTNLMECTTLAESNLPATSRPLGSSSVRVPPPHVIVCWAFSSSPKLAASPKPSLFLCASFLR